MKPYDNRYINIFYNLFKIQQLEDFALNDKTRLVGNYVIYA